MNLTISDPKTIVVIALAVVVGWFAVGLLANLRRGNRVLRWMQGGLPLLGERTTFRWLGSSVAQMEISRPKPPFRTVQLMLVLAPRDVPWFWLLAALRGRKDILIFRAKLSSEPAAELEMADPASWTGRTALNDAAKKGWMCEPYEGYRLCAPEDALQTARGKLPRLQEALRPASAELVRLAVQRDARQVEVHVPLPRAAQDPRAYFKALQAVARALADRSGADRS